MERQTREERMYERIIHAVISQGDAHPLAARVIFENATHTEWGDSLTVIRHAYDMIEGVKK